MDVPADVLQSLKCSRCEAYLSRGPVYLQHDGAALCGCCFAPEHPATRMQQYEAVAKLVRFPCRNKDLGCTVTVPFVDEGEVIDHEEVCEHRRYVCPVLGSAHCDWLGTRADILQHCSSQHPDLVLKSPTTFRHDITRANTHTYLLTAFQVMFVLYTKVCLVTGRIRHSVWHLGTSEEAAKYKYNLDIKRGEVCVSKPGVVAPLCCLDIQEPTSLAVAAREMKCEVPIHSHHRNSRHWSLVVNTNSLLEFLGGIDGTTFTVTVKQRVSCAACGVVVPGLLYREDDGWRCERCAPARRVCKKQGCTHTDIDIKYWKHEAFFCQQRIKCYICKKSVSQGSLYAHYDSAHSAETYRTGSTWRPTRTNFFWGCCLASSVAGTAVFRYGLDDSRFVLWVCIPVLTDQLSEFRCTMRLTHRATGHARNFTLDACYTYWCDWRIVVEGKEFPSCSSEFDVCVDIIRARTE